MTDPGSPFHRFRRDLSSCRITKKRLSWSVRVDDEGRMNRRLRVDLLASMGLPQLQSWTEQGMFSLIELLLIYFRGLLGLLGMGAFGVRRQPAWVRKEIVGNRAVAPRAVFPREDLRLSVGHVLGRFGAPPGVSVDGCPWRAIGAERLGRSPVDFSELALGPRQKESS